MRGDSETALEGGEEDKEGSLRLCSSQKKLLLFTGDRDAIGLSLKDGSVSEVTIADLGRLYATIPRWASSFPLDLESNISPAVLGLGRACSSSKVV